MDVLFFISVACFFALFVAALAIARHVRIERVHHKKDPDELRRIDAEVSEHQSLLRRGGTQSVQNLSQEKEPDWRFLVADERGSPEEMVSPQRRKPPASAHSDRLQRLNLTHFNKDPGDLSDPYQPPITRAAHAGGRRSLLILPRKEAS